MRYDNLRVQVFAAVVPRSRDLTRACLSSAKASRVRPWRPIWKQKLASRPVALRHKAQEKVEEQMEHTMRHPWEV
eukprot:688679-Amphidinium_carterae.1